jgi:hypothetical protein
MQARHLFFPILIILAADLMNVSRSFHLHITIVLGMVCPVLLASQIGHFFALANPALVSRKNFCNCAFCSGVRCSRNLQQMPHRRASHFARREATIDAEIIHVR